MSEGQKIIQLRLVFNKLSLLLALICTYVIKIREILFLFPRKQYLTFNKASR